MNLLSLVGPRLNNIYQIRRKWYYSSDSKNLQNEPGLKEPYDWRQVQGTLDFTVRAGKRKEMTGWIMNLSAQAYKDRHRHSATSH